MNNKAFGSMSPDLIAKFKKFEAQEGNTEGKTEAERIKQADERQAEMDKIKKAQQDHKVHEGEYKSFQKRLRERIDFRRKIEARIRMKNQKKRAFINASSSGGLFTSRTIVGMGEGRSEGGKTNKA